MGAWVQQKVALSSVCDAMCVESACDRVLSSFVAGLQAALLARDTARPVVGLDGVFIMTDVDADACVDTLQAPACTATWAADPAMPEEADASMSGSAAATFVAPGTSG